MQPNNKNKEIFEEEIELDDDDVLDQGTTLTLILTMHINDGSASTNSNPDDGDASPEALNHRA